MAQSEEAECEARRAKLIPSFRSISDPPGYLPPKSNKELSKVCPRLRATIDFVRLKHPVPML
jgi:hypothetical protein